MSKLDEMIRLQGIRMKLERTPTKTRKGREEVMKEHAQVQKHIKRLEKELS